MQFQVVTSYIYSWPVKVVLPDQEKPGEVIEQEFMGRFQLQTDAAAMEMQAIVDKAATIEEHVAASKSQIRRYFVGWDEATLLDEQKRPILFTPEKLDELMAWAPFRVAVIQAYGASLTKRPVEGN